MGDSDDDETFALMGTALKPIDPDAVPRKKPIPIEDQIVTDENGKRRFHGAFTGGFSAGYWNTVGSRDGWTPKSFKSSRSDRKDGQAQKPQDFMDDEDMGDFGFAPQKLKTSAQFQQKDNITRKRKFAQTESEGPIPGQPVLEQVLKPARDTIGIRLLREMGWKPGQGIGPRLSKKEKKTQKVANVRMYGCALPSAEQSSSEDEADVETNEMYKKYRDFLFAPDDVPDFVVKPKENQFGIGYKGLDKTSVLSSGHINLFEPTLQMSEKQRKIKFSGHAFGVGAYEEEDEDVYTRDDFSRYDFALDVGGTKSADAKKRGDRKSRWGGEVEKVAEMIEGFKLAGKPSAVKKHFPPPDLPKDFQPHHRVRKTRFEEKDKGKPANTNPTPNQRKNILFAPSEKEPEPEKPPAQSEEQLKKFLATNIPTAEATLGGFQPFAKDADKQKRYEQYLVCIKNNRREALPLLQPKTMTEWEKERERVEFERASMLYRPLAANMASKFVSGGSSEDVDDKMAVPIEGEGGSADDAKKAAKMKLFGKLTREKVAWHPAKMLCVRFNIKHPYGDYSIVGVPTVQKSKFELFNFLNDPRKSGQEESTSEKEVEAIEDKTETQESNKEKVEEKEEVVPEKPSMDLFKAIFLDSDDDEGEEEKKDASKDASEKMQSGKSKVFGSELESEEPPKPWEKKPENVLRNPQPAKGIFANIDFDALNSRKPRKPTSPPPPSQPSTSTKKERMSASDFFKEDNKRNSPKESDEEDSFGPAKPPTLSKGDSEVGPAKPDRVNRIQAVVLDSEDSDMEMWGEKGSEKKSRKKKKKKEKKKHKKKKSKKSKKKKSKSRYSSSSSETDDSSA